MPTIRIGKRGTVVIPSKLRKSFGITEGSQVIVEPHPEGLLLRPVVTLPIEIYPAEKKAEFLLNSAVSKKAYRAAVKRVRQMGLDPKRIPHEKPEDG